MAFWRSWHKLVVTLLRNDELVRDVHLQIRDNHGTRGDHVDQIRGVVHVFYSIRLKQVKEGIKKAFINYTALLNL